MKEWDILGVFAMTIKIEIVETEIARNGNNNVKTQTWYKD